LVTDTIVEERLDEMVECWRCKGTGKRLSDHPKAGDVYVQLGMKLVVSVSVPLFHVARI
jgi:hypothetical protein